MFDEDNWNESDHGVYLGTCEHCGHDHVLVARCPDPWTAEMDLEEDNPATAWCYPCHDQRCDDRWGENR